MVRNAVTEQDKAVFDKLIQDIDAADSYFCCGGTLNLSNRPLTLYYTEGAGQANLLDFHDLFGKPERDRQTAIDNLVQACAPAPHGRNDETVLDESYRLARELSQNSFALSVDLLSEVGSHVLPEISAMTSGRLALTHNDKTITSVLDVILIPRIYKLNAYAKGGFFKPHQDTPKGKTHVGTLMVALPVAHRGGALRVRHNDKEFLFDWHEQCTEGIIEVDGKLQMTLPWAFLFSDVEHEVLPVESGTRITIAYDIFYESALSHTIRFAYNAGGSNASGFTIQLFNDFVEAYRDPSFLSKGGQVAIALSHSYPMPRGVQLGEIQFAAQLKGIDAIVFRAMNAAGFNVSLRAVLPQREHKDCARQPVEPLPDDGYGPSVPGNFDGDFLVTSTNFITLDTNVEVDDYDYYAYSDAVRSDFEGEGSFELIWLKKPSHTFEAAGVFITYANEPSIDYFYSAAAFILDIPAFGEGSRLFS